MDLLATVLALYAMQCAALLPGGAVLFARPFGRWRILGSGEGPHWRLLHPAPGAPSFVATRLPICETERGTLLGPALPVRWGLAPARLGACPEIALEGPRSVRSRGVDIEVDGRRFARAPSPQSARERAAWLRALLGARDEERHARVAEALRDALSREAFEAEYANVQRGTRVLRALLTLYAASIFGGIPALAWTLQSAELALGWALPVVGVLHAASLFALERALRAVWEHRAPPDLAETLLTAALYPPLLLRTVQRIRIDRLARFHPAAAAAALLPAPERRRVLRAEIVLARARAARAPDAPALGIARAELRELEALAQRCGEPCAGLLAPQARAEPSSVAYCPACTCEYTRSLDACPDCAVELAPYSGVPAGLS